MNHIKKLLDGEAQLTPEEKDMANALSDSLEGDRTAQVRPRRTVMHPSDIIDLDQDEKEVYK